MNRNLPLCCAALALLLLTGTAMAQGVDLTQSNTAMNGLLGEIHQASNAWSARLQGYALRLLFGLAVIQFVWTFMPLVFKQADFGEIVGELVKTIVVVGFFYALIEHSTEWASAVVNSFREAGARAANLPTEKLMPGDMFALAVEFSEKIVNAGVSILSPITSVLVGLSAIIVLLCFAFIAALIFVTLVEAYVVINASVLLYGFGGSRWTRDFAIAPLRYGVAVGVKLFVLTLLVGLIMEAAQGWSAKYTNDQASLLTLVGLALVCAYLTKTIPELMGGMISGTSMGGGSTLGSMAAAGSAGAAAALATAATAGAAAPAAAGVATSAGGAGAAGAGSGGLAQALNASISGGQAVGSTAGSTASAGGLGSTGQAAGNTAKAVAPRIGGGETGGVRQVAKAANQTQQQDSSGQAQARQQPPAPAPAGADGDEKSRGGGTHSVASGLVRTSGILSAIAVPGMESTAGLSLGASPPASSSGSAENAPSMAADDVENIIRPDSSATASSELPKAQAPAAVASPAQPKGRLGSLHVPGMDPTPQGGAG